MTKRSTVKARLRDGRDVRESVPRVATIALFSALSSACAGAIEHPPTDPRWLDPMSGRATAPLSASAVSSASIKLLAYGDTRGGREQHRAVIEAMRGEHADAVLFTGDALRCFPIGHMPDWRGWQYVVPFWPQYFRGYAWTLIGTVFPFPALVHQGLLAPFVMTRDPDGFNAFLQDTAPLRLTDRVPLLFVPGNHDDYHDLDRVEVARLFAIDEGGARNEHRLYFAADLGRFRVVVLDTGTDLLGDRNPVDPMQLAWLDATLADAENKGIRAIVAMHLPPFSSGAEDGPVPWVEARIVKDVLDKHDVAFVVTGHAHAYERLERPGRGGKPVPYFVTGGGGAPYHHESKSNVDPRSKRFIERTPHYVAFDLGPSGVHARFVPVGAGPAERDELTF